MLVLAVAFSALGVAVELGGANPDLLLVAPLLCLAIPLLGGRYLGEERLARLAAAVAVRRRRPRRAAAAPTPRRAPVLVVRGGRLIGAARAVRPPPAALLS